MTVRFFLLAISLFISSFFVGTLGFAGVSSCFSPGGIGSFNSSSEYNSWYKEAMDLGTISLDTEEKYGGASALKVVVDTYSSWQIRIFNTSCFLGLETGRSYLVEFWLKGDPGNDMALTLMDGGDDPSRIFDVASDEWTRYSFLLTPSVDQPDGKLRVNFKSPGTYYLDELTITETDCHGDAGGEAEIDECGICAGGNTGILPGELCVRTWIKPSDKGLRYNGVVESDISDTLAILRRFKEDYILKGEGFTPSKARTQSGISLSFRTASPLVALHFDVLEDADQRNRNFAVFRDGALLEDGISELNFEILSPGGGLAEYEIYLPSFSGVVFKGLELAAGSSLENPEPELKPVYVAIGNSITHGVGQSFGSHLTYPYHLADSLGYRLYNMGIGGSIINSDVISNLSVLPSDPALISVLWGYNNAIYNSNDLSLAMTDYDSLICRLARQFPGAEIAAILQTYTSSTVGKNPANSIERLRSDQLEILQNRVLEYGNIRIVDGWELTTSDDLSDAVHLSDDGALNFAHGLVRELGQSIVFAPEGAQWHYEEYFAFDFGVDFIRFTSSGDSILNGRNCRRIEKRHQLECYSRPQTEFVYTEKNRVWFWDPVLNDFQILYDLNARAGDSWSIRILTPYDEQASDSVVISVDSLSYTEINDHRLLTLHVSYDLYFEEYSTSHNGTILERIGDTAYMFNWFPSYTMVCDANFTTGLRCYEDDYLGLYKTGLAASCEYVATGVDDMAVKDRYRLYPNPTGGISRILPLTGQIIRLTVYNASGVEVISTEHGDHVDLGALPTGIYLVRIEERGGYSQILKILRR